MSGWFASWYRATPERRQVGRARAALIAYAFLLLQVLVPEDVVRFWVAIAMAPIGVASLLQVGMGSDSFWFDRFGMLIGGLVALLGWWLTGVYFHTALAIVFLSFVVLDVILQRRQLP